MAALEELYLARSNNYGCTNPTEEEIVELHNSNKLESTKNLNEYIRNEYIRNELPLMTIGITDYIEQYIFLGADINNTDHDDGNTPLIAAVLDQNIEHISILLFKGADVMFENSEGLTVFDIIDCIETETGETFPERIKSLLTNAKNAAN